MAGVHILRKKVTSLQVSPCTAQQCALHCNAADPTVPRNTWHPSTTHAEMMGSQELTGYDLVVNCTGLGARTLFRDTSMYPIRGHVIRVHAPWIKSIYFMDEQTYVIPNLHTVVSCCFVAYWAPSSPLSLKASHSFCL